MTNSIQQVKPQVLHLIDYADNEMQDGSGQIYIALTPETPTADEAWAFIKFTCSVQTSTEWGLTWGMREVAYPVLNDVQNIKWEVVEVDGCEWSPSDSDKAKIEELIGDYVAQNADVRECVA